MARGRARRVIRMAGVVVALTIAVGPLPSAFAQQGEGQASPEPARPSQRSLQSVPESETTPKAPLISRQPSSGRPGDITTEQAVSQGSPSDCWGNTNNPHQSTSSETYGKIKGYAETFCNTHMVPFLYVEVSLWEKRWWGYDQQTPWFANSAEFNDRVARSAVYDGCKTNRWRNTANHTVQDRDGKTYHATTMEYDDITCW